MKVNVMKCVIMAREAFFNFLVVMVFLTLVISCDDSRIGPDDNTDRFVGEEATLKAIGAVVAKAVSDEDVRAYLINESARKFDADYDILVQMALPGEVRPGETFLDVLRRNSPDDFDIEGALNRYPLLTIFVPRLSTNPPGSWTSLNAPRVALALFDTGEEISVVDVQGAITRVSKIEEPPFPVIVLKENERVEVVNIHSEVGRSSGYFQSRKL